MGKTTLDLDDVLIEKALSITHLKTKKAVIELALKDLIHRKNQELLRLKLGTFDIDLTPEQLSQLRENE